MVINIAAEMFDWLATRQGIGVSANVQGLKESHKCMLICTALSAERGLATT